MDAGGVTLAKLRSALLVPCLDQAVAPALVRLERRQFGQQLDEGRRRCRDGDVGTLVAMQQLLVRAHLDDARAGADRVAEFEIELEMVAEQQDAVGFRHRPPQRGVARRIGRAHPARMQFVDDAACKPHRGEGQIVLLNRLDQTLGAVEEQLVAEDQQRLLRARQQLAGLIRLGGRNARHARQRRACAVRLLRQRRRQMSVGTSRNTGPGRPAHILRQAMSRYSCNRSGSVQRAAHLVTFFMIGSTS